MAKINDTSAYGLASPTSDDILIGSDTGYGGPTKNFLMSDIATYVMSANTLTLQDVCDQGSSTTTDITVGGVAYLARLSVSSVASFSFVDVSAAIDANSTADIADTLTLSKATGTGLQVDANAIIDGRLNVSGNTLLSNLGVTGALDANSTADITGNTTIGGSLNVSQGSTFQLGVTIDNAGLAVNGSGGIIVGSTSGITSFGPISGTALNSTGGLLVSGTSFLGDIDAGGVADIADTLTLSKVTGTGLDVVADASIGGTLTMGIGDGVVTNQITAPPLSNIAFYMGGVQTGAFVAPLGGFVLGYGLTVQSGSTILQDTLVQGGLYTTPDTPASASASGMAGQIAVDADYIYVCTATNTWGRVAVDTW